MFEFLIDIQRTIKSLLTADINTYAASENGHVLLTMLPFAIVFGMAHALTPGHSKAVLASYVVGSRLNPWHAVFVSIALSATHILLAVLLATITNTLITRTLVGAGQAPALEYISRISLAAIGLWLIYRALRHTSHVHGEGIAVGFVAGMVPCPLTLFVMVFAISRGVPEAGLAFSVSMFLGVSVVLVGVALLTVFAREFLLKLLESHMRNVSLGMRLIDLLAGIALVVFSLLEIAI